MMADTIYPSGTLLRVTVADHDNWGCHVGQEFVVDEYIPAEKSEDGTAFYWGSTPPNSGDVSVPADWVELVHTAEWMAARTIPTAKEIIEGLDLLGDSDSFETIESAPDGENSREVYGKTPEGLYFAFKITVEAVWEADA